MMSDFSYLVNTNKFSVELCKIWHNFVWKRQPWSAIPWLVVHRWMAESQHVCTACLVLDADRHSCHFRPVGLVFKARGGCLALFLLFQIGHSQNVMEDSLGNSLWKRQYVFASIWGGCGLSNCSNPLYLLGQGCVWSHGNACVLVDVNAQPGVHCSASWKYPRILQTPGEEIQIITRRLSILVIWDEGRETLSFQILRHFISHFVCCWSVGSVWPLTIEFFILSPPSAHLWFCFEISKSCINATLQQCFT